MRRVLSVMFVFICAMSVLVAGGASESAKVANSSTVEVNPEGFPIVNEPLTLTVFGIRDANQAPWDEMLVFQEYEKMTGIHMDFQESPDQGKDEKKSLLFASDDLPDVFVRPLFTANEISRYGVESGQLMPLNDLIPLYCPNLNALLEANPQYKAAITAADGNIYTLPQIDISDTGKIDFKQWINKNWLKKLGLEVPTTTDEMIEVLRAFKTQDPNGNGKADEIPMGIREPSSIYSLGGSFGLHYNMQNTINLEDGKVHFWLQDERFKEYLQYLNQLYSEGLLWMDYYKRDLPAWRSNLSNALFGVFYMPYSDVFLNVEDQFIGFDPLEGPHGDKFWASTSLGIYTGAFALSNTCSNPAAALRWVDYFYSEEGSVFYRMGVEGKTFYYDENGDPQMLDSLLNDERGFMTALGEVNLVPGGNGPNLITNQTNAAVASELTKQIAAELIKHSDSAIFPPNFTPEENEEIVAITQDLDKYRDESVTKFIIGEWSFDMWDEYCNTLDKIGIDRLEEIYQAAYDRSL